MMQLWELLRGCTVGFLPIDGAVCAGEISVHEKKTRLPLCSPAVYHDKYVHKAT